MKVSFVSDDGGVFPHTEWEHGNRRVIHIAPMNEEQVEQFLCVWLGGEGKVRGEIEKETTSLCEALAWLSAEGN
jgi:hypothetical protein